MTKFNQIKSNIYIGYFVLVLLLLNACNGGGTSLSNQALSNSKAITAYSINGIPGAIDGESINVTVPLNSDVESLIATFTTTGTAVTVNGVEQISGTTVNDFTNPLIYVVTAADGSTANYTVTVVVADDYVFNMHVNSVESGITSCSQIFDDKLTQGLAADPQTVMLAGYYDILTAIGNYNVVNYQNLGVFVLFPLGIKGAFEFGNWTNEEFIVINGSTYSLYGITFDVPGTCRDQSTWGECGVLSLLVRDINNPDDVCAISST